MQRKQPAKRGCMNGYKHQLLISKGRMSGEYMDYEEIKNRIKNKRTSLWTAKQF